MDVQCVYNFISCEKNNAKGYAHRKNKNKIRIPKPFFNLLRRNKNQRINTRPLQFVQATFDVALRPHYGESEYRICN